MGNSAGQTTLNYLFKADEEYKTIQVYITNEEINIINYNKPLPPITIEDLNNRTIFKERDSIKPELRDIFKRLGKIESYGTGVRKPKMHVK